MNVHQSMRRRVHDHPEVFALLPRIHNLLASHGFLECFGAAAHFAIYDVIILCDNGRDLATDGVLLEIMHDTCDFSYLSVCQLPIAEVLQMKGSPQAF